MPFIDIVSLDTSVYTLFSYKFELKTGFDIISLLYTRILYHINIKNKIDKIKLWKEALKSLTKLLLIYTEILSGDVISDRGAIEYTLKRDYSNYDYLVEFPPYQTPSFEEKVEKYTGAINNGLISWDVAFKDIYKDILSDEEIQTLIDSKKQTKIDTMEENK